jgi:4-hydroxybenzoate polyprenyltransferase
VRYGKFEIRNSKFEEGKSRMRPVSEERAQPKRASRAPTLFRISNFEFRIFPILQLLRPPNLFTVPGDPLCGFLLASRGHWSWRIVPCIVVSLASYCAGLVINDLADYSEDLRDRPGRPLPSGAVSRRAAVALALSLIAVAIATGAFVSPPVLVLTFLLIGEILWYNLLAKKSAFFAPIAMGLCRGLSVMLGAAAIVPLQPLAFSLQPFLPSAVITLYIAGVTLLARNETRNPRIPPQIGSLIRGLLFIQAGFCAAAGGAGWIAALLLLALWPVSRLVASHFYAS